MNDPNLRGGGGGGHNLSMSEYLVFALCEFSIIEVGKGVLDHMICKKFKTFWIQFLKWQI